MGATLPLPTPRGPMGCGGPGSPPVPLTLQEQGGAKSRGLLREGAAAGSARWERGSPWRRRAPRPRCRSPAGIRPQGAGRKSPTAPRCQGPAGGGPAGPSCPCRLPPRVTASPRVLPGGRGHRSTKSAQRQRGPRAEASTQSTQSHAGSPGVPGLGGAMREPRELAAPSGCCRRGPDVRPLPADSPRPAGTPPALP